MDGAAAVVVAGHPGYGSATELPEHDEAPSGTRTRELVDSRRSPDTIRPAAVVNVAVVGCDRVRGVEPRGLCAPLSMRSPTRSGPRRGRAADSPGFEPGPPRLELGMLPLHHESSRADGPARTGLAGVAL